MKTISADILMQRLTKTLYADRMSKAVGALGRMVKSIWVLRYLNDRALRGKVRKQLNRG
jgi:TnpA family transposase